MKFGCWNESASIKQYMQAQGMASGDFKSLENEFFTRMGKFVGQKLGKKLLAWEEVFFTDSGGNTGAHGAWVGSDALSAEECIVEVWTGPDFVAAANDNGYDALLAYGWYLDRQNPIDDETTWYFMDTWAQMYVMRIDMFMFRDYSSILLLSYSISSGALGSPELLLSYSVIVLVLHITTILKLTHPSIPKLTDTGTWWTPMAWEQKQPSTLLVFKPKGWDRSGAVTSGGR